MKLDELTLEEFEAIDADANNEALMEATAKGCLPSYLHATFDSTSSAQRHTLYTVKELPVEGKRNSGLPKAARYYLACGLSYNETQSELVALYSSALGETAKERDVVFDVEHAISSVFSGSNKTTKSTAKNLVKKQTKAANTIQSSATFDLHSLDSYDEVSIDDIIAQSPDQNLSCRNFLETLFKEKDLISSVASKRHICPPPMTRLDLVRCMDANPDHAFYIVPQLSKKEAGKTLAGKPSYRSSDSFVNKRLFLVMEFDAEYPLYDENGQIVRDDKNQPVQDPDLEKTHALRRRFNDYAMKLGKGANLAAAVDSGGKSVHFWFSVRGMKKADVQLLVDSGIRHGADPGPLTQAENYVRMPNGLAEGDRRQQKCIYLNAEVVGKPFDDKTNDDLRIGEHEEGLEHFMRHTKFNSDKSDYWHVGHDSVVEGLGHWRKIDKDQLNRRLATLGVSSKKVETSSQLDEVISSFVDPENCVDQVFPFYPAKPKGVHRVMVPKYGTENEMQPTSKTYLVANELPICPLFYGEFSNIQRFMENLFGGYEHQLDIVLMWLRRNVMMYRSRTVGDYTEANKIRRLLNIVGETSHGKSFFVEDVLKPIFGGTSVSPAKMWIGNDFNGQLLTSPLMVMDDSGDMPSGRQEIVAYTQRVKESVTSFQSVNIHDKGVKVTGSHDPMNFFVRLCNESQAALESLCDFEDNSTLEKMLIVRTTDGFADVRESKEIDPIESIKRKMRAEVPCFYWWLLNEYEPPAELFGREDNNRYGSTNYHNPQIMEMVVNENRDLRFEKVLEFMLEHRNARYGGKSESEIDMVDGWDRYQSVGQSETEMVPVVKFTVAEVQDDMRHFISTKKFSDDLIDLAKYMANLQPRAFIANFVKPMMNVDYVSGSNCKRLWHSKDDLIKETGKFTVKNKGSLYYIFVPHGFDVIEGQNDFEF